MEDFCGREALLPEGADGQGVVALGETDAVLVGEEMSVEVGGSGKVKGLLEEDLAGGGFEEVAAADYFGDLRGRVVDHTGELVRGKAVFAPDEKVAEVFACGERLWAEVFVLEADRFAVGDAEAVVDVGLEGRFVLLYVEGGAADAGVDRFVVGVFVRCVHHAGEVFAAAMARVDVAGDEELVESFAVEREALGLVRDWWLPRDAKPCEVFEDGFGEVWFRALCVEVFDAEEECAVGGCGALVGGLPEGGGVA